MLFCTDTTQQLDVLPLDIRAYDCAFTMADGREWMFNPEGLDVFYCHSEQHERLALRKYGWYMLEHTPGCEHRD